MEAFTLTLDPKHLPRLYRNPYASSNQDNVAKSRSILSLSYPDTLLFGNSQFLSLAMSSPTDPSPQPINKEPKRVPRACTNCRQRKLKCRVPPTSTDGRCQRCVDTNIGGECLFVPVNSGPPSSTMSTNEPFQQFRVDAQPTGPYAPTSYSSHAWPAQSGGAPPLLATPESAGPDAAANFPYQPSQGYAGPPPPHPQHGQILAGHHAPYQVAGAWPPNNYYGQPPQMNGRPVDRDNAGPSNPVPYAMPYGAAPNGPTWSGNPSYQFQPRSTADRNYPRYPSGGQSEGSSSSRE